MWNLLKTPFSEPFIGLYALYDEKGLIYIGHSTDVPRRVCRHDKKHKTAKYRKMNSLTEARNLEEKLIRRLKPSLNKDFTRAEIETKTFSCALELDVWKAIKIKHAVKDVPVSDIVNEASHPFFIIFHPFLEGIPQFNPAIIVSKLPVGVILLLDDNDCNIPEEFSGSTNTIFGLFILYLLI